MKSIKGFYTHLVFYVLINVFLVFVNTQKLKQSESYFETENFYTLFFWGIGLIAHGLRVFIPNFIFGENWEEKKILEIMDTDK